MMGERAVVQEALFYEFSLDRQVPANHLLRSTDRFVELSGLRSHLEPFYSAIGRPSVDPELMIRILIFGYCFGIRSERRLCEEGAPELAYRWFCRLGLEGDVPDHSTFSKNRHGRFRDSNLLRELFETTVRRCIAEGLVGGEGFAVDASLIRADANKQRSAEGADQVDWKAMAESRRSVQEYLDTLDDAAWGRASDVQPKFVPRSDPAAQWTGALKGHAFFAYATNYLIDLDNAVIVDVEASRAIRQAEVGAARTMIERTQDRFDLWPARLAADSAYGSAENLAWLVHDRAIEPHIPVFDKSERQDGTFSRSDFTYDHTADAYVCPAGKLLRQRQKSYNEPRRLVDADGMMRYRASKLDCPDCSLKPRCCPNTPARKIPRSVHEGARDMARDIAKTDEYVASRRQRKKVEMLFAHLKRILKLDRLRLRDRTAPATSSIWQPPPRTSASSQS
jgi:transposase